MTTPAHDVRRSSAGAKEDSPLPDKRDEDLSPQGGPAVDTKPRSKRIYIYWGIALTLLTTVGLFSWLVVVPVWEVHEAVDDYICGHLSPEEVVSRLGGKEKAGAKLATYLRMPAWVSPHKNNKNIPSLPGHCGEAGRPALVLLLDSEDEEVLRHTFEWISGLERVPREARDRLQRFAQHDDEGFRQAATEALQKIKAAQEKKK